MEYIKSEVQRKGWVDNGCFMVFSSTRNWQSQRRCNWAVEFPATDKLVLKVNKGSGRRSSKKNPVSVIKSIENISSPGSPWVSNGWRQGKYQGGNTKTLALSLCIMHMPIAAFGGSELGGVTCGAVLYCLWQGLNPAPLLCAMPSLECHVPWKLSHTDCAYLTCLSRATSRSMFPSCLEETGSHLSKHTWEVPAKLP